MDDPTKVLKQGMDKERFCDFYCPIPIRYVRGQDTFADCDFEEKECPFKCVDFSKVVEMRA
jgi:hypothetical protein